MKKFLTTFLFACSCLLVGTAVACKDDTPDTPVDGTAESRSVVFEEGEGFTVRSNLSEDGQILEGYQLTFQVETGAFYAGNPVAYVNENTKPISPNAQGMFNIPVGEEDMTIRIEGIKKDTPSLSSTGGTGVPDNPFTVSKPIDLLYMAEMINQGVESYCKGEYLLMNDIDCKGEELEVIGDGSLDTSIFCGSFTSASDPQTGKGGSYTISNFVINTQDANYTGLFGAVYADASLQSADRPTAIFYDVNIDNFEINAGVSKMGSSNKTLSAGGLIGYSMGATLFLCDATNGEVNVTADVNYFGFVGGLVGYQLGFYDANYGRYYPSEITYSVVDVDVTILGGTALYAGGISGYLATNVPYGATATLHNSYSLGGVSGALRTGGVAGGVGQYTSVANAYATGAVSARSANLVGAALSETDEYCHAYAGGIVGFGENDSVVHDSFFTGTTSADARSGDAYEHTGFAVAGGYPAGNDFVNSQVYAVYDCKDGKDLDLTDTKFFTNNFGWEAYDWVFKANALPVINYEAPEDPVTLKMYIKYVDPTGEEVKKVLIGGKDTSEGLSYFTPQSTNYHPFGDFLGSESVPIYRGCDTVGYRSFGYFLDEACTQKLPNAYLPTKKDFTIYCGFADTTPVAQTYELYAEGSADPLSITFTKEGKVSYSDGGTITTTDYTFDGKYIYIESARLARYYNGEPIVEKEESEYSAFSKTYAFYPFMGEVKEGEISFYDGTFFTKKAPLTAKLADKGIRGSYYIKAGNDIAYYTFYGNTAYVEKIENGKLTKTPYENVVIDGDTVHLSATESVGKSTLKKVDDFRGTWVKSATVNKVFYFDGTGSFIYTHTVYERSLNGYFPEAIGTPVALEEGSYVVNGEQIEFAFDAGTENERSFTATLVDGVLTVVKSNGKTERFYADHDGANNGLRGNWQGTSYQLNLLGIGEKKVGNAEFIDGTGFITKLLYEVSETEGYLAFYTVGLKGEKEIFFGYATYDLDTNLMSFVYQNAQTEEGYTSDLLYLYDDFYGEWVSDIPALANAEFSFNGMGLYSYLGSTRKGVLTITEENNDQTVAYTLTSTLEGYFTYTKNGASTRYNMSFDEDLGTISIEQDESHAMYHKDVLAGYNFVDLNGNAYLFDGKSSLSGKGTLTITTADGTTKYTYDAPDENGVFKVYTNTTTEIGSVKAVKTANDHYYALLLNGNEEIKLYQDNEFIGEWAISGAYSTFQIGPTNLDGEIHATFKNKAITMTYLTADILTFSFDENKMPITYYVYIIENKDDDGVVLETALVLSEFTSLMDGGYTVCSKVDELYGDWIQNNSQASNIVKAFHFDGVTSAFASGSAILSLELNHRVVTTDYYYMVREKGIVLWSRDTIQGTNYFYYSIVLATEDNLAEIAATDRAYVKRDKDGKVIAAFLLQPVDGLYLTEAEDKDENEYFFDGLGNLFINGEKKYTYKEKQYADDVATLELTDVKTGKKYSATLDYSGEDSILFTLGTEIVEESQA